MHAARRSPFAIGVLAAELAVGAFVLAPPAAADDGPEPIVAEPALPPATGTAEPPTDVPEPPTPRTGRAGEVPPPSPDTPLPELPVPELPENPAVLPPAAAPTVDAPLTALRTGRAADATPVAPSPAADGDTAPATDRAPRGRGKRKGAPTASGDRTATPATAPAPTTGAPPPTSAPAAAAPPAHVVAAGESLWHIAGAHLAASTGRDRADVPLAEVAAYWVRVCDANAGTIRSGDLDLIYPGEVVQLPAL